MGRVSLEDLIRDYIDALDAEKGYSAHTRRAYRHDLEEMAAFARDALGLPAEAAVPVSGVTPETIHRLLAHLYARNRRRTIARKLAAIRSFFAHLVRHDLAEVNPAAAVATPKLEKTIPRCPSVEDMFRLLDGLDDGTLDGLRSAALFEVLYSTGARVSELVGLDVRDVDPRQGQVRLRGKGGKDRDVPIGTRALAALDRYRQRLVAERMVRPEADGPLFLNADGGRLTDRSVRRILARLCRETGLPAPVSPHGVRHGYATHLLDGGADLRSLQELLGHKQLSTTQKYTHVSIERLMEVHGKAHPRR